MSAVSFDYIAVDRGGAERRGVIDAATREDAYRRVAHMGLTPLKLKRIGGGARFGLRRRRARVSSKEIAHFTYQLSALLSAHIPVSEGIRSIAEQETNLPFRRMMMDTAAKIQAGSTITEAMSAHRQVFGDVYIETLRAAEQSGNLVKCLGYLAEMLERQLESRQHVRSALLYPIIVVIGLGSATLFLLAVVVPKFADMFGQRGVDLPLLTQMLQGFGVSLREFWWLYGLAAAGVFTLGRLLWNVPQGRRFIDRSLHRVPYLNRVLVGLAVSRFARVFGLGLESGLGLIDSLEMSGRASGRPLLMKDVEQMIDQVRQGGRLSEVLRRCEYLPSFARRLIAAGEEAAELSRMCSLAARHYERDATDLTKNASTVIEPVLIALLTGVVLIVALAIFLPMWDMVGLVG